ncbi:MAG: hypothetical protein RLZ36_45 [Pseudomonadota bacterium]|jgi:uncharacterized protein (DUF488 family)
MTIYTIGYEGLGIDEFISLLKAYDIETVVDIRELPLSRKPGFSKTVLSNTLQLTGLEYIHIAALGCPKPVRDQYREDGNWQLYIKGFTKYLSTQMSAIESLSMLASISSCALLCYEADFNFCHRSMVADAVHQFSGMSVVHIQTSDTKTKHSADRLAALA